MRSIKILLSTLSAAALLLTFSACNNTAANTANNPSPASSANQPAVNKPAPAAKPSAAAETNASKPAADGIRSVDFLNYTYQTAACAEDLGLPEKVKVGKGKFKDADNFYNVIDNQVIYGDLNGDGSEDAVIRILCGASNSATLRAFEIPVYTFQNGKAELLGRIDSAGLQSNYQKTFADGTIFVPGEKGVRIENGRLIVEALADGSFASPANIATFDYKLSGGKFVLSGKPTRKAK